MFNWAVLVIVLHIISLTEAQSQFLFDRIDSEEKPCVVEQNGVNVHGTCSTIHNCPSDQIFNHTVCHEGAIDKICCPNDGTQSEKKLKTNLEYQSLACKVANSNENGVIKFLHECPELNTSDTPADHMNILCDYEICSDLVCCPLASHTNRLKHVCSNVDHPIDTLTLRLAQNQECTIKELNMKGVYQRTCDYAERNPHLVSLLQNVCNDVICDKWYCCPIEDVDRIYCMERIVPSSIAYFVGPKCVDSKSGRSGTCKLLWECGQLNRDESVLDKCGSHCCKDYYCCPDEDQTDFSISAKACLSYSKYLHKEIIEVPMNINKTCTFTYPTAAGGILSSPGEFPHIAALGYESGQEILWNCGGSLISDRYVLTAAHCLSSRIGPVKKVRLGVVDLLNDVNTLDCPEEYGVARQIPHPEYTTLHVYNDIGLIELDKRVQFNFHIRPLCLPSTSEVPQHLESMGWGAIGAQTDEKSVKLLKVYQTLFTHEECDPVFRNFVTRKVNKGILNETQICAGSRFSIQSTCKGDSGGPLVGRRQTNMNTFDIYGIVSFGTACGFANSPGIYTKVYPYVKWIEGIVFGS